MSQTPDWAKDARLLLSQYEQKRVLAFVIGLAISFVIAITAPIYITYTPNPPATALLFGGITFYISVFVILYALRKPAIVMPDRIANNMLLVQEALASAPVDKKGLKRSLRASYRLVESNLQEYGEVLDTLSVERLAINEGLLKLKNITAKIFAASEDSKWTPTKDQLDNLSILASTIHQQRGITTAVTKVAESVEGGFPATMKAPRSAWLYYLNWENLRRVPAPIRLVLWTSILSIATLAGLPYAGISDLGTRLLVLVPGIAVVVALDQRLVPG